MQLAQPTIISQKLTQNASPNKHASDHHTGNFIEPVSSISTLVLQNFKVYYRHTIYNNYFKIDITEI